MAASYHYPPEFWDALSEITLTRRALKEFDRRTAKEKTPVVGEAKSSTLPLWSDRQKLLYFVKNGGPNLNHLRGYANLLRSVADISKSRSHKRKRTQNPGDSSQESTQPTEKTSTTGPYNSQFQQKLADRGVFPEGYEDSNKNIKEPANIDSLRKRLSIRRNSLSPSCFTNDAFKHFQRTNRKAQSESEVMSNVIPIIKGVKDIDYETHENTKFNNAERFALNLKIAQPDKYYGACPDQVHERVRHDLYEYIVPSVNTALAVVPNFFLEGKGTGGRPDVAQRQVMYDNAIGARAMFMLQNYRKKTPTYDGNAYTIGSSYCDGVLKIYATHPRLSASGRTEYYMIQLGAYAMTHSADICRQGIAAYRNSRDFTKEQRDRIIDDANASARSASISVKANVSFGSDTSTDELARDHDPAASDEPHGKACPRKGMTQAASTGPNIQASNTATREDEDEGEDEDQDGDEDDDDDDEIEDDDDDEVEDEDDIHAATHGPSIPNKATSASPRSRSKPARSAMARLREQGNSMGEAFNRLHERSKRISRRVSIRKFLQSSSSDHDSK